MWRHVGLGRLWSAASLRGMRHGRHLGILIASLAVLISAAPAASGETTHTYAVALTISVDRPGHLINGTIITDAPSEFCEISSVRIVQQMPGKDKVVKTVAPYGGEFHASSPKFIRGKRVYAEVLGYHLPSRPVVCLAARSRTVTAP
jgi:hypothetical protein